MGTTGGMPVRRVDRGGTIKPRRRAREGGRRNPPARIGMCMGRKTFPKPTRWKSMGRASPKAPRSPALEISRTVQRVISLRLVSCVPIGAPDAFLHDLDLACPFHRNGVAGGIYVIGVAVILLGAHPPNMSIGEEGIGTTIVDAADRPIGSGPSMEEPNRAAGRPGVAPVPFHRKDLYGWGYHRSLAYPWGIGIGNLRASVFHKAVGGRINAEVANVVAVSIVPGKLGSAWTFEEVSALHVGLETGLP